jgi:hypothetical protein
VALSAYSRCKNSCNLGLAVGQLVAQVEVDQAPVAANAVLRVHHRVAHFELAQVLDQRFNIADLLLLFAPARGGAGGKQFGFSDKVNALFQPAKTGVARLLVAMPIFVAGQKLGQ